MSYTDYDLKSALPNKSYNEDGTTTDLLGNIVNNPVPEYENKQSLPNKWLNPDGSYSTLLELISGAIDTELFIVVDELPASGETNKIYLLVDGDNLIEYLWTGTKWDPIGMVQFDISQYSTTEQMNAAINAALNSAKAYSDTNFLRKDNTTAFTPTADYHPATKKYVDDNGNPIDVAFSYYYPMSLPKNIAKTYVDATILALFNEIVTNNTKRDQVFYTNNDLGNGYDAKFIIRKNSIDPTQDSQVLVSSTIEYNNFYNNRTEIGTRRAYQLTLSFTDGQVVSVTSRLVNSVLEGTNVLSTNTNYSTPYIPKYDGSPATKKYVDDSISTNITQVLGGSY